MMGRSKMRRASALTLGPGGPHGVMPSLPSAIPTVSLIPYRLPLDRFCEGDAGSFNIRPQRA